MTVIAMTREVCTLGQDVAVDLAAILDIEIVHHDLVERHLAERLQTNKSSVHRFLVGQASLWERWSINSKQLSLFTAAEVLDLAQRGNALIRGWGAAQLLADIPHVIRVRICAPMADRIAEMMKRLKISDVDIARREIERNDEAHADTIQRQFGKDSRDPSCYDIILNTGRVPVHTCVRQIRLLADDPSYEESAESRAKLRDRLIEARVQTVLDGQMANTAYGSGLNVAVQAGSVRLSGVTTDPDTLDHAIRQMRSIDGVSEIVNKSRHFDLRYGI